MSCLYIFFINPLSVTSVVNIFSHSIGYLSVLLIASFAVQKFLSLIRSHLFIFAALLHFHWSKQETILAQNQDVRKGFPGSAVVKNLPANAGDMGSSPGLGRFPHAAKQLSPCATTAEPAL